MPKSRPAAERFHEKYEINEKTWCWEWTGALDKRGYGVLNVEQKAVKAHRFSLLLAGIDVDGLLVCHKCDNPRCVNPDHLYAGTAKQNSRDAVSRGRTYRGERRWNSRLSEDEVKVIREIYSRHVGKGIAGFLGRWFAVSKSNIYSAVHKSWKHV